MSAMMLLGVNIDHVATLRQARGTAYPSPAMRFAACTTRLRLWRTAYATVSARTTARIAVMEASPTVLSVSCR